MKGPFISLIFPLFFTLTALGQQSDTISIKPGVSIDNICLLKASRAKVRHFKKIKYSIDKGHGVADRDDAPTEYDRYLTYASNSLTFEFSTQLLVWPFHTISKLKLRRIVVHMNAKTSNGLIIGRSTRQDVIARYGQPSYDDHLCEAYCLEGIGFRYDKNGVISEIEIFPPCVE